MQHPEHRKFIRYDSLHLLDYLVLGEDGEAGIYSMGRTLDVCIDGMKLETIYPLKADTHLLITLGMEDDLVNLEGKTTYCKPNNARFVSGVTFLKITKNGRRVLALYIEAFRKHKNELESLNQGEPSGQSDT
jgi:hypothetical protein